MVKITPNPAHFSFVLEYAYDAKIEIVNSWGQIVSNQRIIGGQTTIDVQFLPIGLYFLIVNDKGHRYIKKIVVV